LPRTPEEDTPARRCERAPLSDKNVRIMPDSTLPSRPVPSVVLITPEPELLAAIERGVAKLGEAPTVRAAELTDAATLIAGCRPFAVIVPADVFAFDAAEFRALARDVGAEVFSYDTDSGSLDVAALLLPELEVALARWATSHFGPGARQAKE
jgi:hypothetical protein